MNDDPAARKPPQTKYDAKLSTTFVPSHLGSWLGGATGTGSSRAATQVTAAPATVLVQIGSLDRLRLTAIANQAVQHCKHAAAAGAALQLQLRLPLRLAPAPSLLSRLGPPTLLAAALALLAVGACIR